MGKFYAMQQPKIPATLDLYAVSSSQQCPLGTRIDLGDGRSFVYTKAGAVDLVVANLMQNAVVEANHLNCAVAAVAAIGAEEISVTLGATAAAANLYKEGFLHIDAPAGSIGGGQTFKVKSHAAIASTGTGIIKLYDSLRVALTASSKATLTKHPHDGVVIFPTTQTGIPVGVTIVPIAAAYYGWVQVKGPVACLINGTVVVGNGVAPDTAVAGAVIPEATTLITSRVGTVMRVNADDTYALINLDIPGF